MTEADIRSGTSSHRRRRVPSKPLILTRPSSTTKGTDKRTNTCEFFTNSEKDRGVRMHSSWTSRTMPTSIQTKFTRSTITASTSNSRLAISWIHLLNERRFSSKQALFRKPFPAPPSNYVLVIYSRPSQRRLSLRLQTRRSHLRNRPRSRCSAPKRAKIRRLATLEGCHPASIKFFCTFTPALGRTDEEAYEKLEEVRKYASTIGGLVLFSGWTVIKHFQNAACQGNHSGGQSGGA
jgi:hypothetical protein